MQCPIFTSVIFQVFLYVTCIQALNLTVTLNDPRSTIRGHALKSTQGNDYYAYQDIPYALAPIGENRFAEPKSHTGWSGTLNATSNTKRCVQFGVGETEDCLVLNVYAPLKPLPGEKIPDEHSKESFTSSIIRNYLGKYHEKFFFFVRTLICNFDRRNNSQRLPVFVWIHGGAFIIGSGSFQTYNPSNFMDYDIIVVTINYRLGTFGFLTTEDGVIPGNLGIKDQLLALKWVNRNIGVFGGDPLQVTIGGQSAGSISASSHIVSQRASGLFRAAILQSGSSMTHGSFVVNARNYSLQLGRHLDRRFTSNNSTELLRLLRNATAAEILVADQNVQVLGNQVGMLGNLKWGIVVEDRNHPNAYITEPIHGSFMNGSFERVPILSGYTSEELIAFIGGVENVRSAAAEHDLNPSNLISYKLNILAGNQATAGSNLKRLYTNTTFSQNLASFVQFSSDVGFVNPIIREADLSSNYVNVYLYEFNYKGANHRDPTDIPNLQGVGHSEELSYMWSVANRSDTDLLTSRRLLTMWSNFIKNLHPTPTVNATLGITYWQPLTSNSLTYMDIGSTLVLKQFPKKYFGVRTIFDQYLRAPFNIY